MSSEERPWFLCVAAGLLQVPLIRAAQALGFRALAIDKNPSAPGMVLADAAKRLDIIDIPAAIELARRYRVAGVAAAACEPAMPTVAAIVETLNLHGPRPAAILNATNKYRMRTAFSAAGIPVPRFCLVADLPEAEVASRNTGFPLIVKPIDSSGSRGVSLVERASDLEAALNHALSVSDRALIEEYLEGPELSVETLTFGGRTHVVVLSDKSITPWPYPVEDGQAQPSTVGPAVWAEASDLAAAGIAALGIDESAGHTEIKVTPRGCRIVEIGARQGGDFMGTHMTPFSVGVDMNRAVVQIATGSHPQISPRTGRAIAVRYLLPKPGVVQSVFIPPDVLLDPDLVDAVVYVHPGDHIPQVRSSLDRAGHVLALGDDTASAIQRAKRLAQAIRILTL